MSDRPRRPTLGLLGSGEFEPWSEPVERRLLAGARPGPVAILPTASWPDGEAAFETWARKGVGHYRGIDVDAKVVALRTREDAFDPALARELDDVSLVFFSGGRPSYLAGVLAATPFWRNVLRALEDGAAYAGCSAGACVLGEMAPDSVTEKLFAPDWAPGLRLLPDVLVTPHWDALNEHEPGMREFARAQVREDCVLLAIDERTALIGDGNTWAVMGEGSVRIGRRERWSRHGTGDRFRATPGDREDPTELAPSTKSGSGSLDAPSPASR